MFKNQLQELAQRSCFNLPSYSCIREGPDHAPRFKATVNFNGETFESPNYCNTLRQAEHAAAEVALNTLSKRGPSQFLAARILDESGVCKNLLQETAQRAGVSLPVYTTIRVGPGHLPVFKCIVEVAGRIFPGEPAKTKKQAEKNAAMAAWSAIKQWSQPPLLTDSSETGAEDQGDRSGGSSNALALFRRDASCKFSNSSSFHHHGRNARGRAAAAAAGSRADKSRLNRDGSPAAQFHRAPAAAASSSFLLAAAAAATEAQQQQQHRLVYAQQRDDAARAAASMAQQHFRGGPPPSAMESPPLSPREMSAAAAVAGRGIMRGRFFSPMHHQKSRLSWQSRSDRFELRRPDLMEELQLLSRDDDDWLSLGDHNQLLHQAQLQQQHQQSTIGSNVDGRGDGLLHQRRRPLFQSQSERFELRQSLLDELYQREEIEWLRAEMRMTPTRDSRVLFNDYDDIPASYSVYSNDGNHMMGATASGGGGSTSYSGSFNDGGHGESSRSLFTEHIPQDASNNGMFSVGVGHPQDANVYSNSLSRRGSLTAEEGFNYSGRLMNATPDNPSHHHHQAVYDSTTPGERCGYGSYSGSSNDYVGGKGKASVVLGSNGASALYSKSPASAAYHINSSAADIDTGPVAAAAATSSSSSIWARSAQWWASHRSSASPSSSSSTSASSSSSISTSSSSLDHLRRTAGSLAPPVRIRHIVPVRSAPPPRSSSSPSFNVINDHPSLALPPYRPMHSLHGRDVVDLSDQVSTLQLFEQLSL